VELGAVCWSFLYFFCLLCGYYVLRPVRDEMGIQAGLGNLPWLFTAAFVAMLAAIPVFGWVSSRFPRRRFLPYVYLFFVANLLVFFVLFKQQIALAATTKAFFVWVSVFNLFVVSVFWSFMADLYRTEQARRLYGLIAAGGSAGAVTGPALTTGLALPLGPVNLLLVSAGFLLVAVFCILRLTAWASTHVPGQQAREEAPVGGGMFDGIALVARSPYLLGICAYVVLYSALSTFLYFEQQHIVKDAISSSANAHRCSRNRRRSTPSRYCNWPFSAVSAGSVGRRVAIPLFTTVGFRRWDSRPLWRYSSYSVYCGVLASSPSANPRAKRCSILSRALKYKAKNFMDAAVYRGGDTASSWASMDCRNPWAWDSRRLPTSPCRWLRRGQRSAGGWLGNTHGSARVCMNRRRPSPLQSLKDKVDDVTRRDGITPDTDQWACGGRRMACDGRARSAATGFGPRTDQARDPEQGDDSVIGLGTYRAFDVGSDAAGRAAASWSIARPCTECRKRRRRPLRSWVWQVAVPRDQGGTSGKRAASARWRNRSAACAPRS
jgi:AAA family ATP:ADP antiporter